MSEKQVEKHLVTEAKRLGGVAVKFPTIFNRSWPDRILLLPGGKIAFIELKAEDGRATLGQLRIIQYLNELGFTAQVLHSEMAIDVFLRDFTR